MLSVRALPGTFSSVLCASRDPKKKGWIKHSQYKQKAAGGKTVQQIEVNKVKEEGKNDGVETSQQAVAELPVDTATVTASAAASAHDIPAFDDDAVPPLDNEYSSVLLDALSAVRKQEQRLAAENKCDASEKSPEHPSAQGWANKRGKTATGKHSESDAQKADGSSRRDRMGVSKTSSTQVSKAINVDLYGTSAGSFEGLGLQKVRFKLLVYTGDM